MHVLLRDVVEMSAPETRAKELTVRMNLTAQQSVVRADPERLQQVFWNIVENAIKFTHPCGSVQVQTTNVDERRIRVEVKDTGVGIEPDALAHLFEAFEQGGKDIARRFGGLGLGLSISQALIAAHKGSIFVESGGRDQGALFRIELPVLTEEDAEVRVDRPVNGASGVRTRILLVEDHEDILLSLAKLLERMGYEVQTARTVKAALAFDQRFDLVISDIGLPDGSGMDLMRRLAERGPIKGVALSGYGAEADVRRCREAGFAEHLTKPIGMNRLLTAIERVIAPSNGTDDHT